MDGEKRGRKLERAWKKDVAARWEDAIVPCSQVTAHFPRVPLSVRLGDYILLCSAGEIINLLGFYLGEFRNSP